MTTKKKATAFKYCGPLDSVTVHTETQALTFDAGETKTVDACCIEALTNHPDFEPETSAKSQPSSKENDQQ
tara:strand:+ start:393 stop:605 length:213 start_codon:yes stop_codon:yes gene_type:complete